jgi:hypothetical protein
MNAMTSLKVTIPMPQISSVEVVDHLILRVTWSAGIRARRTDVIDLSPLVNSLKFYRPLRKDRELFRSVRLIEDGRAITWGDGNIDMPAVSLEQLAEESMSTDDFKDFLKSNNLTHNEAAALLGYTRRQIENYLAGEPIPRVVVMACFGLAARKQILRAPIGRIVHSYPQAQLIDSFSSVMTDTIPPTPLIMKGGARPEILPSSSTAPILIKANGSPA